MPRRYEEDFIKLLQIKLALETLLGYLELKGENTEKNNLETRYNYLLILNKDIYYEPQIISTKTLLAEEQDNIGIKSFFDKQIDVHKNDYKIVSNNTLPMIGAIIFSLISAASIYLAVADLIPPMIIILPIVLAAVCFYGMTQANKHKVYPEGRGESLDIYDNAIQAITLFRQPKQESSGDTLSVTINNFEIGDTVTL